MIKVAVITRTKDRSAFLKRAILSVSRQTFREYEHVIVNDGGESAAVQDIVASQKATTKTKITLFHRSKPSGAPDTIFNESIDRIDSEYVAIHDDDDTWHEDFLAQTVQYLDEHQDVAGVVVRTDKITEELKGSTVKVLKSEHYMPNLQAISLYRQCIDNQLTPIAFLFRRKAYEQVGKFDSSLPIVGDWEFGIRLLQEYDVGFLDPGFALAYYHHRKSKKDNSFAHHSHREYVTKVANKYLRQDLKSGKMGVGYIMSDLKYRDDSRNDFVKRIIPKTLLKAVRRK